MMKVGAVMGCLIALLLLGFAFRLIWRSFDPELMAQAYVSINEVEAETVEEKSSGTRTIAFLLMGMSLIPLGMSALLFAMEFGRDSRIPMSILCLLLGGGSGAVAFRAGLGPAVSAGHAALFGAVAALFWGAAGALLLPYLREEREVTSSS